MRRSITAAMAALALLTAPAAANDSVASMQAGGLVLETTDGITMLSEDLYLSASEVRVTYRFLNHTDEGIDTIVAFPMPDIEPGYVGDTGGVLDEPERILPFITWVDGYAVHTEVEKRAVVEGVDVTERLQALNVPLNPYGQDTLDALQALPETVRDALAAEGVVSLGGDEGNRWAWPEWTLKTTHYWTQYFPPGEEMEIRHIYAPAVGGTTVTMVGNPQIDWDVPDDGYAQTYCVDEAVTAAARRGWASGLHYSETWLDYVLVTGANWSGPIRDFRLVVDKGSTDNLVAFCAEGVTRISPTQFEVRRTNYTPTRDLNVLILNGARYD